MGQLLRFLAKESPDTSAVVTEKGAIISHTQRGSYGSYGAGKPDTRSGQEAQRQAMRRYKDLEKRFAAMAKLMPRTSPKARTRARCAEWLAEFLFEHGPMTVEELMPHAMKMQMSPEELGQAVEDLQLQVCLPEALKDLLRQEE